MRSVLLQFQDWYADQCKGEWDISRRIIIRTLKNPGWMINVNLTGTQLEDMPFTEVKNGNPDGCDWLVAYIEEKEWKGFGDESKLEQIMSLFLEWATDSATH